MPIFFSADARALSGGRPPRCPYLPHDTRPQTRGPLIPSHNEHPDGYHINPHGWEVFPHGPPVATECQVRSRSMGILTRAVYLRTRRTNETCYAGRAESASWTEIIRAGGHGCPMRNRASNSADQTGGSSRLRPCGHRASRTRHSHRPFRILAGAARLPHGCRHGRAREALPVTSSHSNLACWLCQSCWGQSRSRY